MAPRSVDSLADVAAREWGPGQVALRHDATGGPGLALEPGDARTAAAMLQWASREGLTVVPRGSGTKLRSREARRADLALSTARLTSGVDHRAGDLTATLPAGGTLETMNGLLAHERQWLPLDPAAAARATIGGIVATNDSGPRRHRYGTPRDLIIGVELALASGRVARAGGRVVKNVAGYDLSRLVCGSFGTLALITTATFKLAPLPPASRTLVASVPDAERLGTLVLALAASPLAPSAIELDAPPFELLVRFETVAAAADQQAADAAALCRHHGAAVALLDPAAEDRRWGALEARMWSGSATRLKLAVPPASVAAILEAVGRITGAHGVECVLGGRAATGVLFVRLSSDLDAHPAVVVESLGREVAARKGHLTVLDAPDGVPVRVDPWGDLGDAFGLLRAVKARLDPAHTLNPGGGPHGG
jgi:glycolate oxidase FAD binding subunit